MNETKGEFRMKKSKICYGRQQQFSVFEETMAEMTWQEVQVAADRGAILFYCQLVLWRGMDPIWI